MQTNHVLVSDEIFANGRAWIPRKSISMASGKHRTAFACPRLPPPPIRRIDFFRWTPRLKSSIVFLVRIPPSGGSVEPDVCVQPRSLRCKSADLVVLPLNL